MRTFLLWLNSLKTDFLFFSDTFAEKAIMTLKPWLYWNEPVIGWNLKFAIFVVGYFLIRYVHVMSLLFKNYTKFKPKKDLQLQIKTVLFKRGALQQEQQQWWSNQWTLEPNIYGGGGWSPRRAAWWQSEPDAIIIVQLDRASASSAKQRKHWQESCEEYLPIKTRWNILLTTCLNGQRSTVGWIPQKWIPPKKCNCSSLTSDDH